MARVERLDELKEKRDNKYLDEVMKIIEKSKTKEVTEKIAFLKKLNTTVVSYKGNIAIIGRNFDSISSSLDPLFIAVYKDPNGYIYEEFTYNCVIGSPRRKDLTQREVENQDLKKAEIFILEEITKQEKKQGKNNLPEWYKEEPSVAWN